MLDRPFRGSDALSRGLVTPAQLRGPHFVRLFHGIYVRRSDRPLDLLTRSRAAFLLLPDDGGALAGYSAAELLGATCAPRDAVPEIVAPRCGVRPRPGLVVHRAALPAADVRTARGCRVTDHRRTAWDLALRLERTEAVVAVDALTHQGRFHPRELLRRRDQHAGVRGCRRLDEIVALSDAAAESPMESRLRLVLCDAGLPTPAVQYQLLDGAGYLLARFDLAYPDAMLAIEYDGDHHLTRRGPDNHRDISAAAMGWETMRFEAGDIWTTPARTADSVRRMLARRTAPGWAPR